MAEWEEKIFFKPRIFFTGRTEGFKSRFCLRFRGRGEVSIFFSGRGFFTEKGSGFKKSSLLEI